MLSIARNICRLCLLTLCACSGNAANTAGNTSSDNADTIPTFNADSAYSFITRQVEFGPRVPGTEAHAKCAGYIASELKRHGADTIILQKATATAFDGTVLPITNIMGRFLPEAPRRILIAAHYDTRPWADNEADKEKRFTPIPGANDGGSGVGVILELARIIGLQNPAIGVDFLLVDAEDYGYSSDISDKEYADSDQSWCLGTQYWVKHSPYTGTDRPVYAVLLDMVGGTGAKFYREYTSDAYAHHIVDKVWATAAASPYADRFINSRGGALIDDHVFINQAGIPAIDIVECHESGFPPTWHTHADNMDNIDRSTLKAVGQVMCEIIFNEK